MLVATLTCSRTRLSHSLLSADHQPQLQTGAAAFASTFRPPEPTGAGVCKEFYLRYEQLHSFVLSQPRDSSYYRLAVHKEFWSGLADRLTGEVGTFLWSAIESRAYQHTWTFGDAAFDSHSVDLHYREDPSYLLLPPSSPTNRQESGDGRAQLFRTQAMSGHDNLEHWKQAWKDLGATLLNGTFSSFFHHPVEILEHNAGLARWFYDDHVPEQFRIPRWMKEQLQRLGLPDWHTAYGCAINFMYVLKPRLVQEIAPTAEELVSEDTLSICMQIRTVDAQFEKGILGELEQRNSSVTTKYAGLLEKYVQCANEVEQQHAGGRRPVWYVASDIEGVRSEIQARYPDKVVVFPKKPLPTQAYRSKSVDDADARQAYIDAAQEWYLLSLCDRSIFGGLSGFASTAYARSMKRGTAYLMDRAQPDKNGSLCSSPTSDFWLSRTNAGW